MEAKIIFTIAYRYIVILQHYVEKFCAMLGLAGEQKSEMGSRKGEVREREKFTQ